MFAKNLSSTVNNFSITYNLKLISGFCKTILLVSILRGNLPAEDRLFPRANFHSDLLIGSTSDSFGWSCLRPLLCLAVQPTTRPSSDNLMISPWDNPDVHIPPDTISSLSDIASRSSHWSGITSHGVKLDSTRGCKRPTRSGESTNQNEQTKIQASIILYPLQKSEVSSILFCEHDAMAPAIVF